MKTKLIIIAFLLVCFGVFAATIPPKMMNFSNGISIPVRGVQISENEIIEKTYAAVLDGSDDFFSTVSSTSFNYREFTVGAYYYLNATGTYGGIISRHVSNTTGYLYPSIFNYTDNLLYVGLGAASDTAYPQFRSSNTVTPLVWTNIVFTFSKSVGGMWNTGKLYINGNLISSNYLANSANDGMEPPLSITTPFYIGKLYRNTDSVGRRFGGKITRVVIIPRVLNASEVLSLHQNKNKSTEALVYHDFDGTNNKGNGGSEWDVVSYNGAQIQETEIPIP